MFIVSSIPVGNRRFGLHDQRVFALFQGGDPSAKLASRVIGVVDDHPPPGQQTVELRVPPFLRVLRDHPDFVDVWVIQHTTTPLERFQVKDEPRQRMNVHESNFRLLQAFDEGASSAPFG